MAEAQNTKLLAIHELAWVRIRAHPGASDRLPVVKVGKYVRFDLDEVLHWLKGRKETNSSEANSKNKEINNKGGKTLLTEEAR